MSAYEAPSFFAVESAASASASLFTSAQSALAASLFSAHAGNAAAPIATAEVLIKSRRENSIFPLTLLDFEKIAERDKSIFAVSRCQDGPNKKGRSLRSERKVALEG